MADPELSKKEPIVFEDLQPDQQNDNLLEFDRQKDVSEKDVFNLAKSILLACAIIFIIIASLRARYGDQAGVKDVWDFSKVALNSIISLVLGLYFGAKSKD